MLFSKLIVLLITAFVFAGCVKPRNHESAIDKTATFYVDEVKPSMDTAETFPGFTIPSARLFTFTACIRDRRTGEQLPGAPFAVSGTDQSFGPAQDIHTDKNGCAIWSEKITFDYLSPEKYVEIDRTITAKGSQEGARTVKLAINPWKLNGKSQLMYDLEYHKDVPLKQLATDVSVLQSSTDRPLVITSLPIKNTSVASTDGSVIRNLRVYLDPSLSLIDLEGAPVSVPVQVASGKLQVTAALIESVTSGGQETKSVLSRTSKPVFVTVENGKMSADLRLPISKGTQGSRYFLALRVVPVGGPKGLQAFEGLFTLGDLRNITEEGSASGDLKASNSDKTFDFDKTVGSSGIQSLVVPEDKLAGPVPNASHEKITNRGNGNVVKTFSISQFQPRYTVRQPDETPTKRTVIYQVQACVSDLSNGGRSADGVEFSIQRADKTWIKQTASSLDGLHGCLVWEDRITHSYYEPEHWTLVNVTIKHKSGYSETRQYAIDPWQSFRFNADPSLTPDAINEVNKAAASLKSYMIPDAIEFNTAGHLDYGLDDFMNLRTIKTVSIKLPIRVARPSNMIDGISASPEQLRPGSWLLRAAYVSPIMNTAAPLNGSGLRATSHLVVAPMVGGQQVVQVKGGALYADLPFSIQDLRLMNTRAYLVFEVYPYDEKTKRIDMNAGLGGQTFAAPVNFKSEKDASGVIRGTADLAALIPNRDAINSIAAQNQASPEVRQAVAPLAGQTVSKLYAQAALDAEKYRRAMIPQRSLGAVARRANAEFAFVNNEAYNAKNDKNLQANNRILPAPNHAIDALLKTLNTPLSSMGASGADRGYAVTRDELMKAVAGRDGMDERLAAKLCGYFFYTQPRTRIQGLAWNRVEFGLSGNWVNTCIAQIKSGGADSAFSIEHRLNVLATNGVSVKQGGTRSDQQFKTGSQISYAQYQTTSNGWAAGFGSGGLLSELAGAMKGAGGAFRLFSAVLGGLGVEMNHSVTDSSMVQLGFGFEYGHGFMIEQTELNVNVTKYDACMIVRPKPHMFTSVRMGLHLRLFVHEFGGDQKAAESFLAHGLMICNGRATIKPRVITERFFSVVSANQGGGQNDLGDSRGIPWLMQLRGQRDFAAFLQLSSAEKQTIAGAEQPLDIGDLPNAHLQQAYDTYFAGKMSTMPGFITLEPKYVFKPNK